MGRRGGGEGRGGEGGGLRVHVGPPSADISGRKLRIFQIGAGGVGRGGGGEGRGEKDRGLTGSLWPTQCRLETQVEGAEHVNFFM